MNEKGMSEIVFDGKIIPEHHIFLKRKNVFGLINKKPCAEGHVLICSRRIVSKLSELTQIETIDLFMTVQEVTNKLSVLHNVEYEMSMQNGKDAGQTVSHCHMHVYPVHEGNSFEWNQKVRTQDEMRKEDDLYKGMFEIGRSG